MPFVGSTLVVASDVVTGKIVLLPREQKGGNSHQAFVSYFKKKYRGTSLVVQWLRLGAPNAGDLGSIPGQAIR